MVEIYELPQGKITIIFYDKSLSVGLLELNPKEKLAKHDRSVDEELVQVCGSSTIKLFNGDKLIKEVILNENGRITIPTNQYHIHANATNQRSITLWQFEGDILEIIENIRKNFKKIL